MAIDVTKENYAAAVEGSRSKPVIMDFWGPKCSHCLALMPSVEALEDKYAGKFTLCKVNVAAPGNRRVAMACKVMSLPSILFFNDGEEVCRLIADKASAESVESTLKSLIG